ncbi:unnamed protein product [Brachionus calyciflorus]|uniref:G-protein coupled receptors family 1 profile domain-containing protein n=1 Tax=Brachionus calyciflorus TaxID=104777 RepID=A0A813MY79_9BILA|nr:unnamed protein product [Brachionus calyciflorus]
MDNITLNSSNITENFEFSLTNLDYIVRFLNLFAQLFYVIAIVYLKDLQALPLVPMHHTNLIGLINAIHYCLWIISNQPDLRNDTLNEIFCSVSEATWGITKYARAYSILVVAIYRLIGVTRLTLYKKITNSKFAICSIIIVWFLSAFIFLVAKYSTQTTHGKIYCYDGYSPNLIQNLIYYLLTSLFGYALPLILVIIFYVIIQIKLIKISKNLNFTETHSKPSSVEPDDSTRNNKETKKSVKHGKIHKKFHHKKEKKLAHQFIIINFLEFGSMVAFMMLSLNNIYPILNLNYYFLRQLLRIVNLSFQTAIPIMSLLYHPHKITCRFKSTKILF